MVTQDDRTPEERKTHYWLVVGTDRCLSGWGGARGGASVAAWACRPDDSSRVLAWVESRGDMRRVREVSEWDGRVGGVGRAYRPKRAAHFHVYVVGPDHPALEGAR